jgi:hypothetical protein
MLFCVIRSRDRYSKTVLSNLRLEIRKSSQQKAYSEMWILKLRKSIHSEDPCLESHPSSLEIVYDVIF